MQNINLHRLMSELYARPEVEDADIVSCMYEDDTIKTVMRNGTVVAIGVQDEYPAVALYTIYANDEDYRNKEPLTEGLYYDRRRPRLQGRRGSHHQGGVLTHGYHHLR